MEDLARRTQEWKDSHPSKEWRLRNAYSTQKAALVLDIEESRILTVEAGEAPTDDVDEGHHPAYRNHKGSLDHMGQAIPRGRAISPRC